MKEESDLEAGFEVEDGMEILWRNRRRNSVDEEDGGARERKSVKWFLVFY